jgi:hypothetical protein
VVAGEDYNMDYRDPSQNLTGSWAWDMSRTAFARPRYEGSMSDDVLVPGSGRMWRRSLKR